MPVVGVTWDDAQAYAEWAGKRLPTAEEWEWATRGAGRRWFPWGAQLPDGTRANYADASTDFAWNDPDHDDGHAFLAPVGSYPAGATPGGLLDMAGNAAEWCMGKAPLPGKQPIRGGSIACAARLTRRREHDPTQPPPPCVGFRTVKPYTER